MAWSSKPTIQAQTQKMKADDPFLSFSKKMWCFDSLDKKIYNYGWPFWLNNWEQDKNIIVEWLLKVAIENLLSLGSATRRLELIQLS